MSYPRVYRCVSCRRPLEGEESIRRGLGTKCFARQQKTPSTTIAKRQQSYQATIEREGGINPAVLVNSSSTKGLRTDAR